MYFPYLRGRQFELIALRELLEANRISERIVPIIEPVKPSSTLLRHLKELLEIMEVEIPSGTQLLYRARICDEDNFQIGYRVKEMGAPPVKFATAGRTNSEGIQCLYLADSEETTYHEVRARDYDYVSVGIKMLLNDL